jgi:hypothetical protein
MQKHERHLDEKKGRGRESNSKQHRQRRDHSWQRESNKKKAAEIQKKNGQKTKPIAIRERRRIRRNLIFFFLFKVDQTDFKEERERGI